MKKLSLLFIGCLQLSGCAQAPSIALFGAFFPAWLFCIIGALALVLVVRWGLMVTHHAEHVGPLMIFYPSLAALFAFVFWLVFFQH